VADGDLPGGVIGFLLAVNMLVFVLAFFLDFFEISFIHGAAAGAGGTQAGHRPGVVRRPDGAEHADFVHAPAVRFCAVLSAQRGAAGDPQPATFTGEQCRSWSFRSSWWY
jgi:hypothetical protein